MLSIAMPHPAIRVTFVNEEAAYRHWEAFGDSLGDRIGNYARKRDGASHVVLLRDSSEPDAQRVTEWCRQQHGVVAVASVTEPEFHAAPSNAV
jgi:hypothetical protein